MPAKGCFHIRGSMRALGCKVENQCHHQTHNYDGAKAPAHVRDDGNARNKTVAIHFLQEEH